ncbi:MAG: SPOR domain-containing protein, partial [bacterium]
YNDILLLYRKSGYAPKALYKVAQYYFVKGYYFSARKNFLDIARSYPNSKDVSVSQYYAAKCLLATGKTDSARIEFKNILSKNFSNRISELSSEELKAIEEETRASVPVLSPSQASQPNISQTEKKYTIQVGAYSRFENAESQKKYYTLRGYAVEIARAKVNRRYLYKVYIGRFTNQTEAQRFASALKNKHGLSYRIVKLED